MDYSSSMSVKHLTPLLGGVSVLVVDSDQPIANIVKHVLIKLGFGTIHLAYTMEEGINLFTHEKVDLIITDVDTEHFNGEQSIITFARDPLRSPNVSVPIILLTGHAEQQQVAQARDMGITEFAVKPFTAKALTERIIRVIENPRSFIITKRYVGPDRRHVMKGELPPEGDRRFLEPQSPLPEQPAPQPEKPKASFLTRWWRDL